MAQSGKTNTGVDIAALDFDYKLACNTVTAFVRACNVGCTIIDAEGTLVFDGKSADARCDFCKRLQNITGSTISCSKAHLYGSMQAEHFGGKYIYFCPSGMAHFACPIMVRGAMRGAIIGGPLLIVDKEEYILDDIIKKHNIPDEYYKEFESFFRDTVVVPPDMVSHYANLLMAVASFIGQIETTQLLDNEKNNEQQSRINDYIQMLKTSSGVHGMKTSYPFEKEKELMHYIAEGDKQKSQELLNEILGHVFFSSGGKFDLVKARVMELIVILSRAAVEGGADVEQIFGLNYRYLNEIDKFKTVEDISYWLSKIMVRFTDFVFNFSEVKHMDVIYKAVDYIKHHYNEKISLEEVANYVFLSPSYFSKIFKNEMNCNFSTYLNDYRIERSKKLLLNDSINLVDISDMVGFEDQSYFSKVFKKVTGVTPGKYRKARGQLK